MQQEKDVTIGKKNYKVKHIPPTLALEYYLTLQKYALGPVGEMLNSSLGEVIHGEKIQDKNELLEKFMGSNVNIGGALSKLAKSIEPKLLTELFRGLIINGVEKSDGNPLIFEEEFLGDVQTLFVLVGEVVTHNYPNFFEMLLDLVRVKKADSTPAK